MKDIIIKSRPNTVFRFAVLVFFLSNFCQLSAQDVKSESQTFNIEGKVIDASTKEPVAAAQLRALNSKISTITGEDGSFTLALPSRNDLLIITAYFYNPLEIPVGGRSSLTIELHSEVFSSAYKVFETPSGRINSSQLTGAAITMDQIQAPVYTSIDEVLQMKSGAALKSSSRSGLSGIGSSLFIRGYNSVYRNAQPLIVVDGVIWDNMYDRFTTHAGFYTNPLADINISDIESVTVLKDVGSIYGSKGANGAIYIKTRRATDMATKIVVNAMGGVVNMPSSLPMMDVDQYRVYISELLISSPYSSAEIAAMPYLDDNPDVIGYKDYHNNTSWDNETYNQGISQNYNIGVTGGDDKALYSFSLGYTKNKGVVRNTNLQRMNMRFNGDINLNDYIKMDVNIAYTNLDRNLLDDGVDEYTSPSYLAMIKSPFLSPYSYTIGGTLTSEFEDSDIFDVGNPKAILTNALNTNKHYRLNIGAKPYIEFGPNLVLSSQFDYSLDKVKETYFSPMNGTADRYIEGFGISENVFRSLGMRTISVFDDTRLTYNKKINSSQYLNAFVGWRIISRNLESDYAEGHNTGTDQKRSLLPSEDFKSLQGLNNHTKHVSNYANINYNYSNKYFVNAALAVDGSSVFGRDIEGALHLFNNSWGVFPSINLAWLASAEEFLSGIDAINRLKVRTGYTKSGNDDIDPYAWMTYFESYKYMSRANGLILTGFANPEIKWETTSKVNFGLDADILNNKVSVNADFYSNTTTDLLYLEQLPELLGTGTYWSNGGKLTNTGFEINTKIKLLHISDLSWEAGLSIGKYTNKIVEAPGSQSVFSIYDAEIMTVENYPAGVFWGYKTNGVIADDAAAEAANLKMIDENGQEVYFGPGDILFEEVVVDGIIDEKDKQYLGDPNPDFYGSVFTKLAYKSISLEALFTYSYGNEVYNYLRRTLESGSKFNNQTLAMLSRWQTGGQETSMPKIEYGDPMGNARFSDRWIEDASYFKLKSLTLNYKIPVKAGALEGLELWLAGTNLWTLTNYLGRDPEVSAGNSVLYQGIDIGLLPSTRSLLIGLKVNL